MKKQYKLYIGEYDRFSPEYNFNKAFAEAKTVDCDGMKVVKSLCGHEMYWDKWNKRWNVFCGDCGKFWIAEEIKKGA